MGNVTTLAYLINNVLLEKDLKFYYHIDSVNARSLITLFVNIVRSTYYRLLSVIWSQYLSFQTTRLETIKKDLSSICALNLK